MLFSTHALRACKTFVFYVYLLCSGLLILNVVIAADAPLATEQTFPFDDVYRIELNLEVRGHIELVPTDSNAIRVTLTKRLLGDNTASANAYLDSIALTGTREAGTLQLKAHLPNDARFQSTPELQAQLQLDCAIAAPPDVSVKLQTKTGDIRLRRIRGKIELTAGTGDVHLDETQGNYTIAVTKGDVIGKVLLTRGQNEIRTQEGSVELAVLDAVAAPMNVTAHGGSIQLQLPRNYSADVEFESEKEQVVISLPAQIDEGSRMLNLLAGTAMLNKGGPLLRLTATDTIAILPAGGTPEDAATPAEAFLQVVPEAAQPPVVDGNLSEKVWRSAAALSLFQLADGSETAENPTEAFLMWDKETLYVGVKAFFLPGQIPRISQTQQNSPIWEDEAVEILLDPSPQTEDYYHLVVNPIGARFDQGVRAAGPPHFRFAPPDVQRPSQARAVTTFRADSNWDSGANVATRIHATFWSLEIAIPLARLENASTHSTENLWLFNMHRKAQANAGSLENLNLTTRREYSYWLPTGEAEYPWWPHFPQTMGALKLVKAQPQPAESFGSEQKLEVTAVEIEGNATIPTDVVLKQMPIAPGDVITNAHLSWLIAELNHRDWFQEVQLETVATELTPQVPTEAPRVEKVKVRLRVTEAPVRFTRDIEIQGERSFPAQFIKAWFDLSPGYLAVAAITLKQQLIADFYWNRGYEFATVTHEFVNDTLHMTIDEGSLDEIRFTGNTRISNAELASALDLKTSDVYYQILGQTMMNRMRERLSQSNENFKSVQNWRVQREGGKNILIVEIEEQPFAKPGVFPIVGFNRIHGLVLGAGGTLSTRFAGEERLFGLLGRGFASRIWNYQTGFEKRFSHLYDFTLGGGYYKLTDVSHNNALLSTQISLSSAFYGTAVENYYQRQGYHAWVARAFGTSAQLRFEFTRESNDNLAKSTDWSYLNRSRVKRGNSRIKPGQLRKLSFKYAFDTRARQLTQERNFQTVFWPNERTRRGWRGKIAFETAGHSLGGDYAFNLYQFELARYTPLFGPHHLNIRIAGDFSDAPLPRQHLLYLGGGATLRGYRFNAFGGDNRFLLNVEYRFMQEMRATIAEDIDVALGWAFSCFLDTGQVWWFDERPSLERLKTSIGIGFSLFTVPLGERQPLSVAVEIAVPLRDIASWSAFRQQRQILLRLERIF